MSTLTSADSNGFDMSQYFSLSTFTNSVCVHNPATATSVFAIVPNLSTSIVFYSNSGDFTYLDPSSNVSPPAGGTINSVVVNTSGGSTTLQGLSLSIPQIYDWAFHGDTTSFVNALFGGDDSFFGSGHGDTLEGFGGNDNFYLYSGGANVVKGDDGNDTINTSAGTFDTASQYDGGAGTDMLSISGYSTTPIIFNDNTVQHIEIFELGTGAVGGVTSKLSIAMTDANVAAGSFVQVFDNLDEKGTFTFFAGNETDGALGVIGGAGSDIVTTGAGNDFINTGGLNIGGTVPFIGKDTIYSGGGNDTIGVVDKIVEVHGGAGDDTINFGSYFDRRVITGADRIDGGADNDTISFTSGPVTIKLGPTTITNVETFLLKESSTIGTYTIVTDDATVAANAMLTVDAHQISRDNVTFDGSKEKDGAFHFIGSNIGSDPINNPSLDRMYGGAMNDTFDMTGIGAALASFNGNGGDDTFNFHSGSFAYSVKPSGVHVARDIILGGGGNDTVNIDGDYSQTLNLQTNTFQQVETVNVAAGHSYNFLLVDEQDTPKMTFAGEALGAANVAIFNAGQLTTMSVELDGGAGDDILTGGAQDDTLKGNAGNDTLNISIGGRDHVYGGDGNDTILAGNSFGTGDTIDGGALFDTLKLSGNMGAAGAPVALTGITYVEEIDLTKGSAANPVAYHVQIADATAATSNVLTLGGPILTVSGSLLLAGDVMDMDGSHVHSGMLSVNGGRGADILTGGDGADTLYGADGGDGMTGGLGADTLAGGAGSDVFVYNTAAESAAKASANAFDHIADFDFATDKLDFTFNIAAVDTPVTGSAVLVGGFVAGALKTDLASLGAYHAVLYTATDSHLYLVVDGNGVVGFQSSGDYVIDVTGAANATAAGTTGFDLGDFI